MNNDYDLYRLNNYREKDEKEIENRLNKAMDIAKSFVGQQDSGRLSLHIDRYGDIKLEVTLNGIKSRNG